MESLVKERGPIPPEVWGVDSQRRQAALKVSAIIKDAIGWTAANFVPDDPVDILLWHGCYDLGELDAVLRMEAAFFVEIPEHKREEIWRSGLTLGQLVDYLLEHGSCVVPWPRHGEESLESRVCPKMAVFLELRKFVQRHCHLAGIRLRPSTNLRDALPASDWLKFDRYVQGRFGVQGLVRKRFLGVASPQWAWLALSFVAAFLVGKVLQCRLPGLVLGSLLGLMVFGVLVMRLSRVVWRRGPRTAREVVEWILAQRAHLPGGHNS